MRSRILPLLECTILSHLRFSPHPTVAQLNQGLVIQSSSNVQRVFTPVKLSTCQPVMAERELILRHNFKLSSSLRERLLPSLGKRAFRCCKRPPRDLRARRGRFCLEIRYVWSSSCFFPSILPPLQSSGLAVLPRFE
jgi:hypothetical protein